MGFSPHYSGYLVIPGHPSLHIVWTTEGLLYFVEIYSKNIPILKVDTKTSPALHREAYFSHTPPMTSTS